MARMNILFGITVFNAESSRRFMAEVDDVILRSTLQASSVYISKFANFLPSSFLRPLLPIKVGT